MSFDVNVLSTKPVIKAAASMQNDGGGGNLGYMSQGNKKKEKEKKYLDENIFMKKDEGDIFTFGKEPEMPEEQSFVTNVLNSVKRIFSK